MAVFCWLLLTKCQAKNPRISKRERVELVNSCPFKYGASYATTVWYGQRLMRRNFDWTLWTRLFYSDACAAENRRSNRRQAAAQNAAFPFKLMASHWLLLNIALLYRVARAQCNWRRSVTVSFLTSICCHVTSHVTSSQLTSDNVIETWLLSIAAYATRTQSMQRTQLT